MKIRQLKFITLLLLCSGAFAQTFDVVVGQSPPYIDESISNRGFLTEVVEKSLENQGVEYNLQFASWQSAEDSINHLNGVSFAFIKNDVREKSWYFSKPIILAPSILISHRESDFEINELEDIKKFRIGVTRNISYGKNFDKLRPMLELEMVGSDLMNMKKILHKRIDLFPIPLYTAIHYMRENFSHAEREQFEFILYPNLTKGGLHLVCHKKNQNCLKLIQTFNRGLQSITSSGVKDRIVSEYLSQY
ncbi:hypothetical protein A9Q84_12725 [Halobacteriovorax marinus]|uniref:Solute-binding protein family 3/N-terminal domain-containing protein n=1 Tax=Halobacteriovorax marinus TaxID=97084 RepID=A0A1Y5F8S5_9BACT|nr:hypothetical protein A9Q84_12725 [Halobacteriovorax marinus]